MEQVFKLFCILLIIKTCLSFNAYNALTGMKMIFPEKVLEDIPCKLGKKIKEYGKDNDKYLKSSYTFPVEYKTTIYKDHEKKTTLVNVFPTVETKTYSVKTYTPSYQILETSTTSLYQNLNSTILYQTIPMLNSTLVYPTTAPVQATSYVAPEYQHEIHVYPTKVNFTQISSTTVVNFTRLDYVDNMLPYV